MVESLLGVQRVTLQSLQCCNVCEPLGIIFPIYYPLQVTKLAQTETCMDWVRNPNRDLIDVENNLAGV